MLLVHNASRIDGDSGVDVAKQLDITAVPAVRFLDAHGNVTAALDYLDLLEDGDSFAAHITAIARRLDRQGRRKAALQQLEIDLLIDAMELRTVPLRDARPAIAAKAKVASPSQLAAMNAALIDLQVRDLTSRSRELGGPAVREALATMAMTAKLPSDRLARRFWHHVFRHAIANRNPELYAAGIHDLRSRFGKTPDYGKTLAHYESRLEQLRRSLEKRN